MRGDFRQYYLSNFVMPFSCAVIHFSNPIIPFRSLLFIFLNLLCHYRNSFIQFPILSFAFELCFAVFHCTVLSCSFESYYFLSNSVVLFSNSVMPLCILLFSFQFYYSLSSYVLPNPGICLFGRRCPGDQ